MSHSIVSAVNSAVASESVFVGNCPLSFSAAISEKAISFFTVSSGIYAVIIESFFVDNCSVALETLDLVFLGAFSPIVETSESIFAGDFSAMGAIINLVSAGG